MKRKARKSTSKHAGCLGVLLILIIIAAISVWYACFSSMSSDGKSHHIYIDGDDTADSVIAKVQEHSTRIGTMVFRNLSSYTDYGSHVRTGCYVVDADNGALQTFRHIRNGQQSPVSLVVPSVRTLDRLAEDLSKHLMMNSDEMLRVLKDEAICAKYDKDTTTIQCLFIPNTYDVYWNISPEKLLERMKTESGRFWTEERLAKAKEAGMTADEVITLASIVDEETANNAEKPKVAGMYINRLKKQMPLQADPTIKYAWRQFGLKRIYNKLLFIDSPYNTYRNTGLPPGPIRIPSVAGIDAVLNYVHHDYLYMCAKEDFSGTHNFAVTYAEHLKNAAKYVDALNKRGIK